MFSNFSHASSDSARGDSTHVFWDVEDPSILGQLDPDLLYSNIKSAVSEKGYLGNLFIQSFIFYDDPPSQELIDIYKGRRVVMYCKQRTPSLPKGNEYPILLEILRWALFNRHRPSNLIILSSSIREEKQVASVLQSLREKGNYNIVLQDPATLFDASRKDPLKHSGSNEVSHCPKCKSLLKRGESSSQNK